MGSILIPPQDTGPPDWMPQSCFTWTPQLPKTQTPGLRTLCYINCTCSSCVDHSLPAPSSLRRVICPTGLGPREPGLLVKALILTGSSGLALPTCGL